MRQWQTTFYEKRYSQTDPHRRTDFVKLAEGFGLKGYRCPFSFSHLHKEGHPSICGRQKML